jgi:hypothetical protein
VNAIPERRSSPSQPATTTNDRARSAVLERLRFDEQSLAIFSLLAAFFAIAALSLVWPIAAAVFADDLDSLIPIAIVASGLLLLALSSFGCALLLRAKSISQRAHRRKDDPG